jgi:hypothetical protein
MTPVNLDKVGRAGSQKFVDRVPPVVKGRSAPSAQKSAPKSHYVFSNKPNLQDDQDAGQTKPVSRSARQRANNNNNADDQRPKGAVDTNNGGPKKQKRTFDINAFPRVFSTSDLMDKINGSSND